MEKVTSNEGAVWLHVSFDLPTVTSAEKRNYRGFRSFLLESGFWMAQFSVYVMYFQRRSYAEPLVKEIIRRVPSGGDVVILSLSDLAWSGAVRFTNGVKKDHGGEPPEQLQIF